jgi:hypothetical protein
MLSWRKRDVEVRDYDGIDMTRKDSLIRKVSGCLQKLRNDDDNDIVFARLFVALRLVVAPICARCRRMY